MRMKPFGQRGTNMQASLKAVSFVVLALMAAGIVYAGWIAVTYWTGISV